VESHLESNMAGSFTRRMRRAPGGEQCDLLSWGGFAALHGLHEQARMTPR
jgi:hypothetical protein